MPEGSVINPLHPKKRKSSLPQVVFCVVLLGVLIVAAWFTLKPNVEVQADDWINHESASGGFSVRLPGEPELSDRELEGTTDGVHMLTVELPERVYAVAWSEFQESELKTFGAESQLDSAMELGVEAMGGTITKSSVLEWQGNPGREFWADVPGGKAHYRLHLVGLRLYRLAIIHAPGFEANHDEFFGSFKLK